MRQRTQNKHRYSPWTFTLDQLMAEHYLILIGHQKKKHMPKQTFNICFLCIYIYKCNDHFNSKVQICEWSRSKMSNVQLKASCPIWWLAATSSSSWLYIFDASVSHHWQVELLIWWCQCTYKIDSQMDAC